MKGAVLEVLLVSAVGLKHAHLPGSSNYYVVIQCGNHTFTSKITSEKDRKVCWNEKFRFMLSSAECKDLAKLKLRIMEKDKFLEDRPVGETMVYLRGILREGREKGFLELKPSSYNVVLYDGTYEGELKIGLKFISNVELEQQTKSIACTVPQKQPYSLYQAILSINLRGIPWSRFFFFHNRSESRKDR
ncbi:elicitor-responsive protein 3 [Ananas comosus]|uniref:Elicitor-responsive protein 3 n=1 Tax=Ananas comosus TaxID=4615 RepID=A0A6P5ETY4_ANACO|nr:elicitor-responsive protein 3 [Ananas comosus]